MCIILILVIFEDLCFTQ